MTFRRTSRAQPSNQRRRLCAKPPAAKVSTIGLRKRFSTSWSWRILLLRDCDSRFFRRLLRTETSGARASPHCHTVSRAFRCTVLRGSFVKRNGVFQKVEMCKCNGKGCTCGGTGPIQRNHSRVINTLLTLLTTTFNI